MKKEELLNIGLTEEQADKVFAMNGKDIEKHKKAAEDAKASQGYAGLCDLCGLARKISRNKHLREKALAKAQRAQRQCTFKTLLI